MSVCRFYWPEWIGRFFFCCCKKSSNIMFLWFYFEPQLQKRLEGNFFCTFSQVLQNPTDVEKKTLVSSQVCLSLFNSTNTHTYTHTHRQSSQQWAAWESLRCDLDIHASVRSAGAGGRRRSHFLFLIPSSLCHPPTSFAHRPAPHDVPKTDEVSLTRMLSASVWIPAAVTGYEAP